MGMGRMIGGRVAVLVLGAVVSAGAAQAAGRCGQGSFESWLGEFKREAVAAGVSREAVEAGLAGVTLDPAIIKRDHGQGVFQQTFLQFSERMVSGDRLSRGARMLQTHGALLKRIEAEYGVPGPVLVAFWGLETDFGSDMGKYRAPTAVATLAYDCRRADMFRAELLDLMRVVERGDLKPSEMLGDWAGELGHLMFTPSDYFNYGVDEDGDGRRDVIHSVPDALATAANFLKGLGWRRCEPWLREVRVPAEFDWAEADPKISHSGGEWSRAGVHGADGAALASTGSWLWLPMGRNGPAFLAYPNFQAYLGWNKAMVYSTTAAYYATRLAGAGAVSKGRATVTPLSPDQLKQLQGLMNRAGYSTEEPDGRLGAATRMAVKKAQLAHGLPADSYPTLELLGAMQSGR